MEQTNHRQVWRTKKESILLWGKGGIWKELFWTISLLWQEHESSEVVATSHRLQGRAAYWCPAPATCTCGAERKAYYLVVDSACCDEVVRSGEPSPSWLLHSNFELGFLNTFHSRANLTPFFPQNFLTILACLFPHVMFTCCSAKKDLLLYYWDQEKNDRLP